MSDDDEDDAEKTQIFLPGGNMPKAVQQSQAGNQGTLLKAESGDDKSDTAVDFDLTSGYDATAHGEQSGAASAPAKTESSIPTNAAAKAAARSQSASSSSGPSYTTIFLVAGAIIAVVIYFLK